VLSRISPDELSDVWQRALSQRLLDDEDTAVLFIDLSRIAARVAALRAAFPAGTFHTVAIKADPLPGVLRRFAEWGLGLEVASLGELELARRAVPPERIVFDSPAKTRAELAHALDLGVSLNADSLSEVDRLAALFDTRLAGATAGAADSAHAERKNAGAERRNAGAADSTRAAAASARYGATGDAAAPWIGLRVNPQIGAGRFTYTSTAAKYSKFGVPIAEFREPLLAAYRAHPWLQGMHVHIGSQACPPEMMVEGLRVALDFALEINRLVPGPRPRIRVFDIGGGLPVAYGLDERAPCLDEYAALLRARCPELFEGRFRLATEFGRALNASCAWVASRVEYVKEGGGARTIIAHIGADMLLRECYFPEHWRHEMTLLDARGALKQGPARPYVIAGPLCFAGDVVARDQELPEAGEGDILVIRDVGAYTFSMWSRFVSRQFPKVIAYQGPRGACEILKEREKIARVIEFWS
jgi:diaminopimelate decarboxylase